MQIKMRLLCLLISLAKLQANLDGITLLFENAITTYQKAVSNNYLKHKDLYKAIEHEINHVAEKINRPLVIADLGCGDLKVFSSLYASVPIQQFYGIDASPKSLVEGESNFAATHHLLNKTIPSTHWIVQDLLDWSKSNEIEILSNDQQLDDEVKFDVIVSTLAVHHLSDQEKKTFIDNISNRLQPDGILIIGDIYRFNDETRDIFLERFENTLQNHWVSLNNIEKLEILTHVKAFDYPALLDDMMNSYNLTNKYETTLLWMDEIHSLEA